MSEVLSQTKTKKEESSFFTIIKGIGCFFLISLFVLIIFVVLVYFSFKPIVIAINKEYNLPSFQNPSEQDFWNLQEKIQEVNKADGLNQTINYSLTHAEYNALLSSVKSFPVEGFCLIRVRHHYENKILRYYLIGSGYLFKKFNISFIVKEQNGKNISDIKINSWNVPSNTLKEKYIIHLVNKIALKDNSGLISKIISGKVNPVFE